MSVEMIGQTIQIILAPVVMVTTCSIMLGGLLTHYAEINTRLRAMARERLDLLRNMNLKVENPDRYAAERLQEIDTQLPDLLHRHRLIRNSVLCLYSAITIFVVSMFVIAGAVVTGTAWLSTGALAAFLLGTALVLLGAIVTAIEVRSSHRAVRFEVERVMWLGK